MQPQPQPQQQQPSQAPASTASSSSSIVELNVGGVLFTTSRSTLEGSQPRSMLAALVSGKLGLPGRDSQVCGGPLECPGAPLR